MKHSAILIFLFLWINNICIGFQIKPENNGNNDNNAFPKSGFNSYIKKEKIQEKVNSILTREGSGYFLIFLLLFLFSLISSVLYICNDIIKEKCHKRKINSHSIENNK